MALKKLTLAVLTIAVLAFLGETLWTQQAERVTTSRPSPESKVHSPYLDGDQLAILRRIEELEQRTTFVPESQPITIPFDDKGGHIILPVTVNEADETAPFILDSGARMTLIDTEFSQLVGLQQEISLGAHSSYGILRRFNIFGALFHQAGVLIADFNAQNRPIHCLSDTGLIGANLMRHGIWQINYQEKTITLVDDIRHLSPLDGAIAVPFERQGDRPTITLPIGDTPVTAIIDTGWEGGIYLAKKDFEAVEAHLNRSGVSLYGLIDTLAGVQETHFELATIPALTLGGHSLNDVPVVGDRTPQLQPNSLIGNQFLKQFHVTLDWQHDQIYLQPVASSHQPAPDAMGYGFQAIPHDHQLRVTGLYSPSPAEQAGLQVGDRILQINTADYAYISPSRYCEVVLSPLLGTQPQGPLKVTVERDGETLALTLRPPN